MCSSDLSLGIAVYPEDGTTKDALLTAADSSMYTKKKAKHFGQQATALSISQVGIECIPSLT